METYDLAVIGAGPGGYVCAIRAAQLGLKTALIERDPALGGTCLNVGCIPSKALLESSELYHATSHNLALHGIEVGSVKLDLQQMMSRKQLIVKQLTDGIATLIKHNRITLYRGTGILQSDKKIRIQQPEQPDSEIAAQHVCLAMGSVSAALPFMPFDGKRIISSTEALSLEQVPKHLAVIGGGAIGLELGSVWRKLGAEVTVLEMLPRIIPFADAQISKMLERSLQKQGINFQLQAAVTSATIEGDIVRLDFTDKSGKSQQLEADRVLVAVGRKPNTAQLHASGIALDNQRVAVDQSFQTNLPGVYAIGDLIHGPMLAHKASEEGFAVAEIIAGKPGHINYLTMPNVVYTHPEVAQVGITEETAKEQQIPINVGKYFYKANGRAKCLDVEDGLVKIIAHAHTDRILGAHILGTHASELIAELVLAMEFQASSEDIARTIHPHPSLSEIIKEAALAANIKYEASN
jgi:dihydrolipoamide dehydrogenase